MANRKYDSRKSGEWLWRSGLVLGGGGALGTLVGSVAPWVQVSLFGIPLAAPGIAFAGAWSAAAGAIGLASLRRWPLITAVAGLLAVGAALLGSKTAVQQVSKQLLSLRLRLAPINARLEQVHLAPIEPFGDVYRAQRGPGPGWVVIGGVLLTLGGAAASLGSRWRRSCPQCRRLWPEEHLESLLHCPGCGFKRTNARQCSRCWQVAQAGALHCATCGASLTASG